MIVAAIFVAAGSGQRLGAEHFGSALPKAFALIQGRTLIEHALAPFATHPGIRDLILVAPAERVDEAAALASHIPSHIPLDVVSGVSNPAPTTRVVAGGGTRQASVLAGLRVLAPDVELVLVHDVARAFVPGSVIDRVLAALEDGAMAVIPVRPVSDTIKRVAGDEVTATVDRSDLRTVQTPQGFRRHALDAAQTGVSSALTAVTDDAGLIEAAGGQVIVVDGSDEAFKVTHPWDLFLAEALLNRRSGTTPSEGSWR